MINLVHTDNDIQITLQEFENYFSISIYQNEKLINKFMKKDFFEATRKYLQLIANENASYMQDYARQFENLVYKITAEVIDHNSMLDSYTVSVNNSRFCDNDFLVIINAEKQEDNTILLIYDDEDLSASEIDFINSILACEIFEAIAKYKASK